MKQKISLTIEEDNLVKVDGILTEGLFRNRSHVVEYALIKFLGEQNGN
jgi:metal-responsive CopG/Arc/MetJ family transcriptional regulator